VPTAALGRVLIVDEDGHHRTSIAGRLARAGYETHEAATGEQALEAVREQRPALVVLEVSLPDVSGYTVCRQLRNDFGDGLPIIFMSGKRTESYDRMAGFLIGADEYLTNPCPPDEFLFHVQRLLRRSAPAAPAARSNLSAREHEILQLLAEGLSQKEIALRLHLSRKTVGTYLERLYEKLDVHSKTQAVAVAVRRGLVHIGSDLPGDEQRSAKSS
jgi:DNA-binding NarL/FixJ family response regulator